MNFLSEIQSATTRRWQFSVVLSIIPSLECRFLTKGRISCYRVATGDDDPQDLVGRKCYLSSVAKNSRAF